MSTEVHPVTESLAIITADDVNRQEQPPHYEPLTFERALEMGSPAMRDQIFGTSDNRQIVPGGGDLL